MTTVTYAIVEHDGGWAYKVGDVFSETFSSHEQALKAAKTAAAEHEVAGRTDGISYQDASGEWHEELADGGDRPHTEIVDDGKEPASK